HLLRKCKRFRQSMHRGRPTGESFDHCPPGWIRQSGKCCTQFIHNHMVVDYLSMSSVDFAIHDFRSLIPDVPALAGNFLAGLHWKRHRAASCSFKMISFSNINKQYGKQLLFVDASFQLNAGEKVGLVGPNGAGRGATTVIPSGKKREKKTCGVSALVHATPGVTASRFAGRS